jgi:threonine/homoserine/homoserine lactone efflux protein
MIDTVLAAISWPWLIASLVCIATPGTDSIGTLSIGMARGGRRGAAFALGVGLGCLTHTVWAALGIAAIVATSETLFLLIKLAGASYLIYLGLQALRNRGGFDLSSAANGSSQTFTLIRQGFTSNALNPKVMLFFIAFIPQFVSSSGAPVWQQMLVLGSGFALLTTLAYVFLGLAAGKVGQRLMRQPAIAAWLNRLTGLAFIGLALRLAFAERK